MVEAFITVIRCILAMCGVEQEKGGRLRGVELEQMCLFWVWKGERAGNRQRWIAQGLLSRRSELIPFRDAQQETWKGIFQQQHSHCWDAKMQHGWRATLLSNFSQIAGISSGVMFA